MSSLTKEAIAQTVDLFSGLGDITTRRMMGGLCLYHNDVIFAMRHGDGTVRIKGAGDFIAELEAAGCTQWTYVREGKDGKPGKAGTMPYWTLPEEALDDPDLAVDWARRALAHL